MVFSWSPTCFRHERVGVGTGKLALKIFRSVAKPAKPSLDDGSRYTCKTEAAPQFYRWCAISANSADCRHSFVCCSYWPRLAPTLLPLNSLNSFFFKMWLLQACYGLLSTNINHDQILQFFLKKQGIADSTYILKTVSSSGANSPQLWRTKFP